MSGRPAWSYVQARLQARHGQRLGEGEWRALEAARTLDQFIDRARATALRRFTEQLNAEQNSHTIERLLRANWRAYVAETATWSVTAWQPAILWTAPLPDLPAIDAILKGEAPRWAAQDPLLAGFLGQDGAAESKQSQLAVLWPGPGREKTVAARWHAHWCTLLPANGDERRALAALADVVQAHVERLAQAGPRERSASYRPALAQAVTRLFRRHGGTPVALFCHLALVALDLARLRGGLVRRALFEPAKEAA